MRTYIEAKDGIRVFNIDRARLRVSLLQRYSRGWMAFWLGLADFLGLTLSGLLAAGLYAFAFNGKQPISHLLALAPLFGVFYSIYALRGLYPGVGLSPVEELRRLTVTTSAIFLLLAAVPSILKSPFNYSRFFFAVHWALAIFLIPISRWMARVILVQLGAWGEPVALVGYGPQGQKILEFLRKNARLGLRPQFVIEGGSTSEAYSAPVPKIHVGSKDITTTPLKLLGIRTAVLVTSEMPASLQDAIVEHKRFGFQRLILIPNLQWVGSVGVTSYDLEGLIGLEVRQNLLNLHQQIFKRVLDLLFVISAGVLISPLLALIAVLIHVDSPGEIFYHQERVGRNGRKFKMWKFRTMVQNADQILENYLARDPQLRLEWEATQKLRNDPRITRVGRLLRKLSLDELPQLYNILRGEMSLVGPRPFFPNQLPIYGGSYHMYTQVRPGITGMWQVSGRNGTTFAERAKWDEYYVRQWSIWLDIYILIRTIWVVLRRDGAY